jgi:hypothetical protein
MGRAHFPFFLQDMHGYQPSRERSRWQPGGQVGLPSLQGRTNCRDMPIHGQCDPSPFHIFSSLCNRAPHLSQPARHKSPFTPVPLRRAQPLVGRISHHTWRRLRSSRVTVWSGARAGQLKTPARVTALSASRPFAVAEPRDAGVALAAAAGKASSPPGLHMADSAGHRLRTRSSRSPCPSDVTRSRFTSRRAQPSEVGGRFGRRVGRFWARIVRRKKNSGSHSHRVLGEEDFGIAYDGATRQHGST